MPGTTLVSGLAGAIGSDFRQSLNQLVFVEYGGKLSRLNLFRPASVVHQETKILKGTWMLNLDNGTESNTGDIWWEQQTNVLRRMTPQGAARIVNIGVVDFNSVTPDTLQTLTYGTTPIPGNNDPSNKLVNGDVFAVITKSGNYAKVKVLAYGYDIQLQWVTYHLGDAYAVLGTGYTNPEDVKCSTDNVHAYVTERSGDLVRVSLASANRASATVVASGMTAPQQLFLDEAHNRAFVIEYALPGHLWSINLTNGAKTAVLSNVDHGVGLTVSSDLQYAYITEQTAGPDQGRVSEVQISNGARTVLAKNLTNPFFLTWLDGAQNTLLVPERDPANRITSVSVTGGGTHVAVSSVAFRPSSVAITTSGKILVCCDTSIEEDALAPALQPGGPLLMGIGFIPFDKVLASGLATTDPGYFYPRTNVPFGGTLPLMVNHLRAFNDGDAYYRVKVDGAYRSDAWTDYRWDGTQYVLQHIGPFTVAGTPCYAVHSLAELFLWMNPSLGMLMDSTNLSNGLHTIVIEFLTGGGAVHETSTPLTIMVNNQSCVATIATPTLNGNSADPVCGILKYTAKNADPVIMAFTASQPHGYATWAFQLVKGVNQIMYLSGNVPAPPPANAQDTVAHLLGACNTAGFAEAIYVWSTIDNGWSRQSQYDASALIAFVLAP